MPLASSRAVQGIVIAMLLAPAASGAIPRPPDVGLLTLGLFCDHGLDLPENDTWRYHERFCRNLATAREGVNLSSKRFETPLAKGAALVALATAWEAEVLQVRMDGPPDVHHDAPSEAALAVLALAGVPADPEVREQLAAYDALPQPARGALTRVLDAFIGVHDASAGGYARVFPARAAFLEATAALPAALEDLAAEDLPPPVRVPTALLLDLRASDATYTDDFRFALDAGGDDAYLNNAGGNGFACAECRYGAEPVPAAALVDLDGRDRYGTERGFGQNGGSMQGVGLLVDAAGDDAYLSAHFGTNGAACLGTALLLDVAGNDRYEGGAYYTNGGGETGAGLLVDLAGNDVYRATGDSANGGASIEGAGFLLDAGGDDAYLAASWGANGGARYGGYGFLLDLAGDDRYEAGSGGVNGAGPFEGDPLFDLPEDAPFGFLFDAAGTDRYEDQEPANGSGVDRTVVPKGAGAQMDERSV